MAQQHAIFAMFKGHILQVQNHNLVDKSRVENVEMWSVFQSRIKLADQDILNILFHYYPEKLYELPCEWNYRVWLCSEVRCSLLIFSS
jgi:lipopolysaccharide biosynthesis glycosyltransferase